MAIQKQPLKSTTPGKNYEKCNVGITIKDPTLFDKTFSKFKQRMKNSKVMNDVYDRMAYRKPSSKRREVIQKAKSRQKSRKSET
jgi:ribosomal protein S21